MNNSKENNTTLPITKWKKEIQSKLASHRVLILSGETGSGKTTQIPQYIDEMLLSRNKKKKSKYANVGTSNNNSHCIAITQPRRVAAMTIAARVASEMKNSSAVVGYKVRFDDTTSSNTRIKFMTDGMLVRNAATSNLLSEYNVIILDECHVRSVATDFLFGIVKNALRKRQDDDLRVVVMSATLDVELFTSYFAEFNPTTLSIPGRTFPVTMYYSETAVEDYVDASLVTICQILSKNTTKDILVFCTGQEDIETLEILCKEYVTKFFPHRVITICPLFAAGATTEVQNAVFAPTTLENEVKIVLATNIAETSVTIPNIGFVIDCGLVKQRRNVGLVDSLEVVGISKAEAWQRSGRAGRDNTGEAYRLYSEEVFTSLRSRPVPEIQRTSLETLVLTLKALNFDVFDFEFLESPSIDLLSNALRRLLALGAIDASTGELTKDVGHKMASLPIAPSFTKILLAAKNLGCVSEALDIVSILSCDAPLMLKDFNASRFASYDGGDHITLLNIYTSYKSSDKREEFCRLNLLNGRGWRRVDDIRKQLVEIVKDDEECSTQLPDTSFVKQAIVHGCFLNAAVLTQDYGVYKPIRSDVKLKIHPRSVLFQRKNLPRYIIYNELVHTTRNYARNVLPIENRDWLIQACPRMFV